MSEGFEDDQLHRMISESRVKMPFDDFEKDLMFQIRAEIDRKKFVQRNIKLSWFFYGLGLVSGILITIYLSRMEDLIMGMDPVMVVIPLILCLCLIFLLLMEKLVRFSFFSKPH